MTGAIALAALAAVRSGVGLCTVFTVEAAKTVVLSICPEAMCIAVDGDYLQTEAFEALQAILPGKDVILIGPGMGTESGTLSFLSQLLAYSNLPLVVDADALNLLASSPDLMQQLPESCILTPPPGEMSRLAPSSHPIQDRLGAAESFSVATHLLLVLKGKGTLDTTPAGSTYINTSGTPGSASGGVGHELEGLFAIVLRQG